MDKTTKLPNNNMQPSTNLLNCDNQTINLPENSKEPINSNMDTTTKLPNETQLTKFSSSNYQLTRE